MSEFLLLRFYNVYLLVTIYKLDDDFKKILKLLDTNNKSTMNLVDQLNHVAHKTRVKKELAYYVLHILTLKATA